MRIIALLRRKLRSKSGETLTETLASLLIIVPAMVMLAGAIVSAARINHNARNAVSSTLPTLTVESGPSGTIAGTGDTFSSASITWVNEDLETGGKSIYFYFR